MRRQPFRRPQWRHVPAELFLALAVGGGALAYGGVLRGWSWLYPVLVVLLATVAAATLARAFRWHPVLLALGAVAVWTFGIDTMFFRDASLLGFIPTADTLGAAREALDQAWQEANPLVLVNSTDAEACGPDGCAI